MVVVVVFYDAESWWSSATQPQLISLFSDERQRDIGMYFIYYISSSFIKRIRNLNNINQIFY